ncbi:hypothetical protein C8Q74DRAFT_1442418 [Fomes fomentarius]|nr:hypothetical protein C8Q74DRAFT_1442418 [Fomes fomentarius]
MDHTTGTRTHVISLWLAIPSPLITTPLWLLVHKDCIAYITTSAGLERIFLFSPTRTSALDEEALVDSGSKLLEDAAAKVYPLKAPLEILGVIRRPYHTCTLHENRYDMPRYGKVIGPALGN